jgi:hypothetical protein
MIIWKRHFKHLNEFRILILKVAHTIGTFEIYGDQNVAYPIAKLLAAVAVDVGHVSREGGEANNVSGQTVRDKLSE